MIPRWQSPIIDDARTSRRVLLIEGARQSGKTTLARSLTGDNLYRTLDDIAVRQAVETDLKAFLQHDADMMIIDEVQRAPDLIPEIKRIVDDDTRPGQFLLTGSAHIPSLPQVRESLAGRIRRIRLRPFAQGELRGAKPNFLDRITSGATLRDDPDFTKTDFLNAALKGGYPEVQALSSRERRRWHTDYVAAILSRDLQDIAQIRKHGAIRSLVGVLAAWSSKFMDVSAIGSGLSIQRPTLEAYIAALETLFLIERLPAWTHTDYARVGKRGKLFMTDYGLMASLLHYPAEPAALDGDQAGKLAETLVFCELMAQANASDGRYAIWHYRDNEQREIDFLIEDEEGGFIGVEVKAGLTVKSEDFRHMRWFAESLARGRPFAGVVLYAGPEVLHFGELMRAVPASAMWAG
ncbi:MAG: ATP-binding protein [Geminicoccaceae bacterium]